MKKQPDESGRIRFISVLLFLIAAAIAYRLFDLQVVKANYYKNAANRQYSASQNKSPIANRSSIYFREKNNQLVSASVNKQGYSVAINPSALKNPELAFEEISKIIPLNRDDFLKQAKKENDAYEVITKRLDSEKMKEIEKLNIKGVNAVAEEWRFYPGGKLASHVLGFVGDGDNGLVGQYGVEKYYEKLLKDSEDADLGSFSEAISGISNGLFLDSFKRKKEIILTIEPSVQGFLESSLDKILKQYSAESAGGIVIEPKTGKILAMASKPDFDPNLYNKVENHGVFLNPLVSAIFEIGSVMKPITLAAGLDAGKITTETTYYDNGFLIIDKSRIENYDAEGRGKVDMQTVLNKSLNTGAVFAMRKLGKENFREYIANFGLGDVTGIDLPDEVGGNISSLDSAREIEAATASFGQGIAVTPIGFITAFSALANGGYIVRPYITEASENPVIKRQVIKKETSEEITRMLVKVVDEALLEGKVKLEHYSVAAKTGTAQIPNDGQRGYSENYLHAFVGYTPAFDAKFLIFLYLQKPIGVKYASYSLTPVFMDMTKFLLSYYEVSPDR